MYYGQTIYNTLPDAIQSVATDPFVEGEPTAEYTTFIGYVITRGNLTSLLDASCRIIAGGLFRNTAGAGAGSAVAVTSINDLSDVNITSPTDGQALIYQGANWVNGNPSTSSYALTASYIDGGFY